MLVGISAVPLLIQHIYTEDYILNSYPTALKALNVDIRTKSLNKSDGLMKDFGLEFRAIKSMKRTARM